MSEPRIYDPSPLQFADALFAGMREAIAAIDARAEAREAARAEQRRERARATRAAAVYKLPAAIDAVVAGNWVKRTEFDGGFHIEADGDYRPYAGELLRITRLRDGTLTATRKPARGRPERARTITALGAARLLLELVASVKAHTPAVALEPDGCQCPNVANPPCSFCESAEYCERCQEPIGWREWPDHLEEHLYDEALARARARHRRAVRRARLDRHRSVSAAPKEGARHEIHGIED